jgi:hypothetical protein
MNGTPGHAVHDLCGVNDADDLCGVGAGHLKHGVLWRQHGVAHGLRRRPRRSGRHPLMARLASMSRWAPACSGSPRHNEEHVKLCNIVHAIDRCLPATQDEAGSITSRASYSSAQAMKLYEKITEQNKN